MSSVKRRQNPPNYPRYTQYKEYLRKDFRHRCCYCGVCESDWGGHRHFHVDHFRPKSLPQFAELAAEYSNLYYACDICNTYKGNHWPSLEEQTQGFRFWDACLDLSSEHFLLQRSSGESTPLTRCAEYTDRIVRINRKKAREMRVKRLNRVELYRTLLKETRRFEALLPRIKDALPRQMVDTLIETNRRMLADLRTRCLNRAMDS